MAKESKVNTIVAKIKKIKHIELIIAGIAIIIMLVIYFSTVLFPTNKTDNKTNVNSREDYCTKIEKDLTRALSKMTGAGEVEVVINWESSVESIIAYITNSGNNSVTSTPQIIQGNGVSGPIILKELYPKAIGVIIICKGGDDVKVKLDIITAVSVLLDITQDKINVYGIRK